MHLDSKNRRSYLALPFAAMRLRGRLPEQGYWHMLEAIYVIIAVLLFIAQLRNGFFTALLTAVSWPIVLPGLALFMFFSTIYYSVKK